MMMVDKQHTQVSVARQCELLQVSRSGFYYQPAQESPGNLAVMRMLDEQYLKTPFFGVERLLVTLLVIANTVRLSISDYRLSLNLTFCSLHV